MTMFSARINWSPVSVVTSTVLPSRKRALPWTIFTLVFCNRPVTPLVSRLTMPSFQSIVLPRSISGEATEMPSLLPPSAILRAMKNSSAA